MNVGADGEQGGETGGDRVTSGPAAGVRGARLGGRVYREVKLNDEKVFKGVRKRPSDSAGLWEKRQ